MATAYRFLPWARRGLAAALPETTASSSLPQHPEVAVRMTVTGAGDAEAKVMLHGPGDVTGIEGGQILRTYPRPDVTDAEPNFLAAIDLDAPELPWLFTPRSVAGSGRLPPWIVLVVVERRTGVTVSSPRGAPLPQLRIESGAAAELPDLTDSWAWAHVQLVEGTGGANSAEAAAAALAAQPDRNVARLVCPRRLAPNRRWIAALVPAFDAGRVRGLGGVPAQNAPLADAWTAGTDAVTLPMFFHWEFQTGPEGDFEALAQRLKPMKALTTVGLMPMHVGEAAPPLRVPADQARILPMDGALRAPAQSDGRLDQVPDALRDGLKEVTRTLADAADGTLDGQTLEDASRQPVGPPIYASSHVQRWLVRDRETAQDADWFRELNLDPRARVAAGLGAECIRENQEDIVNAAWKQVGDVLSAEAALQRAALSELVSKSYFRRHIEPMSADRLLQVAAPVAARVPLAGASVKISVRASSLPDAVLEGGVRRAMAPAGRAVARAARRLGVTGPDLRSGLTIALAETRAEVDPTRFARPTLTGVAPEALSERNLEAMGLSIAVEAETLTQLTAAARDLAATPAVADAERLELRAEARTNGLLGQAHVEAARNLAAMTKTSLMASLDAGATLSASALSAAASATLLDGIVAGAATAMTENPAAGPGLGLVLEGPTLKQESGALAVEGAAVRVGVLDLDAGGTLVVRTRPGRPNEHLAVLDQSLSGQDLGAFLSRLPPNSVRRSDAKAPPTRSELPELRMGRALGGVARVLRSPSSGAVGSMGETVTRRGSGIDVRPDRGGPFRPGRGGLPNVVVIPEPQVTIPAGGAPAGSRPTVVTPPLLRDPSVMARFETALALQIDSTVLAMPSPVATPVRFDLGAATAALRAHVDPRIAQPLRRDARIGFGGRTLPELRPRPGAFAVDGWWASRALDRVMAYPTFPVAASDYLARYDRDRFCPGIDTVPPNSITLLETNPRFIAAFMAGLNHETNRELLWRGFPTDSRGTPFRRFWRRLDGKDDIPPIHGWRTGTLAEQTTDPKGNLVLLVRGDLLRRYPNTVVVALPALGPRQPDHSRVLKPVFEGQFEPDVSFFGFPLVDTQLAEGEGWFFGLMEPVTEPRFGLDETAGGPSGGGAATAGDTLAWPRTGVEPGGHLTGNHLPKLGLNVATAGAHDLAATLFQRPFTLYVHAKHLVAPLPTQR
ncbi:hypothetical protein FHG66_05485 [Rubellimicrobium rubrum]|uniref:Uncharacterized protein n=1 Tax=Rubellimicrobium rubrum TaxID=2585369 RepID=A0A5C4N1F0_9RHOB|nr:hypothetical protein [Rubellimicrobium rubrum]TNC51611.1 hypothetical protein FHG66_05485 [Rubellimicrobium rubrum]